MRDLEGVVVEFEFADQLLVGRVTDRLQEADIARGPVDLFQITTADDATYRVPEGDIRAT
jgi:hypothetical protein